jgi:hypothetical protein
MILEEVAREREERVTADKKHDDALGELRKSLTNQTRILGVVVAAASFGAQFVGAFFK